MKCFTFKCGDLKKGILIQEDPKFGRIVFLGEEGRGRRYEKISLDRKNPPEILEEKIQDAHPIKITLNKGTEKEKNFFILAKSNNSSDKRILVRVDTSWIYTRNSMGGWELKKGNPQVLIFGYGAHGIAGRVGGWNDGLIVMNEGDVVYIKPEGGYKTECFVIFYEENLQCMKLNEYENEKAINIGEREEI